MTVKFLMNVVHGGIGVGRDVNIESVLTRFENLWFPRFLFL